MGTSQDIQNRINKACKIFSGLKQIWKSNQFSTKIKLQTYQCCVLSVLPYGAECGKTEKDIYKLSTFHTSCLHKLLHIFGPKTISNNNLLSITQQDDMHPIIKRRRWTGLATCSEWTLKQSQESHYTGPQKAKGRKAGP